MLAGVLVSADATAEVASMVRTAGAVELADRLEQALADDVSLLALTIDERAIILAALEDPPEGLTVTDTVPVTQTFTTTQVLTQTVVPPTATVHRHRYLPTQGTRLTLRDYCQITRSTCAMG
jgi:hypothetical protein